MKLIPKTETEKALNGARNFIDFVADPHIDVLNGMTEIIKNGFLDLTTIEHFMVLIARDFEREVSEIQKAVLEQVSVEKNAEPV